MPNPRHDFRDPARPRFGKPSTAYPDGSLEHPTITEERTSRKAGASNATEFLSPHPDQGSFPGAVLTAQRSDKGDDTDKLVTEVYETLPGPWITSEKVDPETGDIWIGKRRKNIIGSVNPGALVSGSQVTVIEAEGIDANTCYESVQSLILPGRLIEQTRIDFDGAVLTETRQLKDLSSILTSESIGEGVWTQITKLPYQNGSNVIAWETIRIRTIPGIEVKKETLDADGATVTEIRQLQKLSDIASGESLAGGIWTQVSKAPYEGSSIVGYKITRSRAAIGNELDRTQVDFDGVSLVEKRKLKPLAEITTSEEVDAQGVWNQTTKAPYEGSNQIGWEIIKSRLATGNEIKKESIDFDGSKLTETRQLQALSQITFTESVAGGIWTQVSKAPYEGSFLVGYKITKSRAVPGNIVYDKPVDKDGVLVSVAKQLKSLGDITQSATATVNVEADSYSGSNLVAIEKTTTLGQVFPATVYSKDRRDVIPSEFKFNNPDVTYSDTVAGTASTPALNSSDLSASEQQVTTSKKRTSRTTRESSSFPTLSSNQTGQWGIESISKSIEGSNSIAGSFLKKSESSTALGDGNFLKETVNYPGTPATLKERHVDPTYAIAVDIEKTLVSASSSVPASSASTIYEVQPIDKWNSIQICSRLDATSILSTPVEYYTSHNISLPDELLEIGVKWNTHQSDGGTAEGCLNQNKVLELDFTWGLTAVASAACGISGQVWTKIKNGYRGAAKCKVTRKILSAAPAADTIPTPHVFKPVIGSVIIGTKESSVNQTNGASGKAQYSLFTKTGYNAALTVQSNRVNFGPVEHNAVTLQESGDSTKTQTHTTSGGTVPGGGAYNDAFASAEATGVKELYLPDSSIPLASGEIFLVDAVVERWRFGVYIVETYEAIVP